MEAGDGRVKQDTGIWQQVAGIRSFLIRINTYPLRVIARYITMQYIYGINQLMPEHIKYALVLNGGGLKGAFQAGVLNYLQDNWRRITGRSRLHFDVISGCSAGSLNGCFMAMNKLHELNTFWDSIAEKGVEAVLTGPLLNVQDRDENHAALEKQLFGDTSVNLGIGETLGLLVSKSRRRKFIHHNISRLASRARHNLSHLTALAGYGPLMAMLQRHVKLEHIAPETRFYTSLSSLHNGRFYHLPHTDFEDNAGFINAVLAAALPPVVCEPVAEIRTRRETIYHCADGSLTNTAPVGRVLPLIDGDRDAEYRLIIINSNAIVQQPVPGREHYAFGGRALQMTHEITAAGIFRKDMTAFNRYNALALHNQAGALSPLQVRGNGQIRPVKAFAYTLIQAPHTPETVSVEQQIVLGWQQAAAVFGAGKGAAFQFAPVGQAAG